MENKIKRFLSLAVALVMVFGLIPMSVFAAEADTTAITGTITEDTTWNAGDVVGDVTIAGNVTITVNGTVEVSGTIRLSPDAICNVVFNGENGAKLIRTADFAGQMFYAEGVSGNFQNLTFNSITLDGGAVWTGDVDKTLNRGTVNEGVKATGSVLYLAYANAELNNSTLQNHEDSTGEKANAVFLRYYSTVAFNDSVVRNNNSISTYYRGGVVTVRQGGTVTTNNADVYGNSGPAGGFFGVSANGSYGGVAEVYNSKFHNNYSDNGAVFLMQCNSKIGYLLIDGCEFYNNASKTAVLTEWAYSRPFIIKDSYFHDNECAVWDCHTDPILDISGKFEVKEDADYTKYLYETALGIGGSLDADAMIPVSDASYAKLMANSGCLMTEVPTDNYYNPTSKYTILSSDMEKMVWNNPDNLTLIKTDVDGNGMLDVVPVNDVATTNVMLYENFLMGSDLESNNREVQAVSAVVKNIPIAVWFHEGFYFTGWADATDGEIKYSNKKTAITYEEVPELYATWNMQALELKLSRADANDPYCNTLKVTVNNKNSEGYIDYSYQWYKDDVAIDGATSDEYTISETASYKCVVTATAPGFETITATASGSATYKEAPKVYVAEVVETGDKYETLAEAVAAANAIEGTATVNLLADVTLGEKLTITGDVTIQGAHTITRDDAYTGTFFTVNAGASLTLDGGLTIDGGNNYAFNTEAYKADLKNFVNVASADSDKWFTPEDGAPVSSGHLITVGSGTVNLNKVTVQNVYGVSTGVVKVTSAGSTVNLTGATITHVASTQSNGVVVFSEFASSVNINDGTTIQGNHVGGNHGLFKVYFGTVLTMNGGLIKDTTGWNSNGIAIGVYQATFHMNGGEICGSTSNNGPSNGRCAAVYLHDRHTFTMSGGTICHNRGGSRGGLDAPYSNGTATITGGNIVYNSSYYAERGYADTYPPNVNGTVSMSITGGWYSEDVTKYCAPGYCAVIDYNEVYKDELWHVVPAVAYNVEKELYYGDLSYALSVAASGETVQLLRETTEELVLVPAGVTFDLNGNVVTANNVLSFGVVKDGMEKVGGIKIDIDTATAFTKLQPENGNYLPIYDTRYKMYKFFAYDVESKMISTEGNSVTFWSRVVFDNIAGYEVLANTTNSGLDFVLTMDWTGMKGFDIRFYMSDGLVQQYAQGAYDKLISGNPNNKAMTATISGVDTLGAGAYISAAPSVETVAEVTDSDTALVHNIT